MAPKKASGGKQRVQSGLKQQYSDIVAVNTPSKTENTIEQPIQKIQQEDEAANDFFSQVEALAQLEEAQRVAKERRALRVTNLPKNVIRTREEHENNRSELKSDLKRSTALIKKLKNFDVNLKQQICNDIKTLNLSRYISEIISAIGEIKLKTNDVPALVEIIILLHQRYDEFTEPLIHRLLSIFQCQQPSDVEVKNSSMPLYLVDENDRDLLKRKRAVMKLLIELFFHGVSDDVGILWKIFNSGSHPVNFKDSGHKKSIIVISLTLFTSFVKQAGEELLGFFPKEKKKLFASSQALVLQPDLEPLVRPEMQVNFQQRVEDSFDLLCQELVKNLKQLKKMEKDAERNECLHGSLTEQQQNTLQEFRERYKNLFSNILSLSEIINRDMPNLAEYENDDEEEQSGGVALWSGAIGKGDRNTSFGPYEDEESRTFYEDLPDLLSILPSVLFGLNDAQLKQIQEENTRLNEQRKRERAQEQNGSNEQTESNTSQQDNTTKVDDNPFESIGKKIELEQEIKEEEQVLAELEQFVEQQEKSESNGKKDNEETDAQEEAETEDEETDTDRDDENKINLASEDNVIQQVLSESIEADKETSSAPISETPIRQQSLDLLLQELPKCHSKAQVDGFAEKFCYLNSKFARRKLVETLYIVSYQKLNLLPFYARLVAILDRVLKDIAPLLIEALKKQFFGMQRERGKLLPQKIKNVKYIAELVKFRVAPPILAFNCLKHCLKEFDSVNAEVVAAFIEGCGPFLLRLKHAHEKMDSILEIMLRLQKAKNFEQHIDALIMNAYYLCKPPKGVHRKVKEYTPIQRYIQYLLFELLFPETVEFVLNQLRKLPWDDKGKKVEDFLLKAFLKITKGKFEQIELMVDILAGLDEYHRSLSVRLIDILLEEIEQGIEYTGPKKQYQRLIGLVKFFGEMYNFSLVNRTMVFDLLYHLINYGHEVSDDLKKPRLNPEGGEPLPPLFESYVMFDPRILTPFDYPTDMLRIQLVVTLLDTCSTYFVMPNSKAKLAKFLTFFQRYILCKTMSSGTECAVLDLFDDLEKKIRNAAAAQQAKKVKKKNIGDLTTFSRFESWDDVQVEVSQIEKKLFEKRQAKIALKIRNNAGDESGDFGNDDEDDDEDEIDENFSIKGIEDSPMVADEKESKTVDDEEFENLFSQVIQESIEKRKLIPKNSLNPDNMEIPVRILEQNKPESITQAQTQNGEGFKFHLLKKSGKGKIETKEFFIPSTNDIVVQLEKNVIQSATEKTILKQRVLEYEKKRTEEAASVYGFEAPLLKNKNKKLTKEDLQQLEGLAQNQTPVPVVTPKSHMIRRLKRTR